jgi:hypothetical protein
MKEQGTELAKLNIEGMALMTWSFQQVWLPNFMPISETYRRSDMNGGLLT